MCLFSLYSTWENIFSAIAFAASVALFPSGYPTSYIYVSNMGLSLAFTLRCPYFSLESLVPEANSGPSLSLGMESSMFKYVSSYTSGEKSLPDYGTLGLLTIFPNSYYMSGSCYSYSNQTYGLGFPHNI